MYSFYIKARYKMKLNKRFFCSMCAVIIGLSVSPISYAEGSTIEELQAQRESLAQKTADAKKELASLESKQLTISQEIDAMDKVLSGLENELSNAQNELKAIANNLDDAEIELENAIDDKITQVGVLGSRLRFLQQKGSTGYFEILMESESFADLFLRMQYVNDIMLFDKDLLSELERLQLTIEQKKAEIEDSLVAQEIVVTLEKDKVSEMNQMISDKEALMASYQADEAKYEELIAANAAADQGIVDLINAEMAKNVSADGSVSTDNTVYYTGSGSLGWPVPSKAAATSSISSGYADRIHPITGKADTHKGYDIPASYGAAIVAAEAGVVIQSGWMNSFGNTIIIDHGGGLTTLYAHNSSLTVSKGDFVTRGQTVAKCGSTGMSTGNHVHFSVLLNSVYQNPESYLGVRNKT